MVNRIKSIIGKPVKSLLFLLRIKKRATPQVGKINFGDFKNTKPIGRDYGMARGNPIDRYYIENFLKKNSESIKGRVLEIGDNYYTTTFGGQQVLKSDVLHLNNSNQKATIIGDLSDLPQVEDNTFDCIILTQTLQFIFDCRKALDTCRRILKPGGTLLLTVPSIAPLDDREWGSLYYWSFTDKGILKLFQEVFHDSSSIEVAHFGNVFTSTAFLQGLCLADVPKEKLEFNDPFIQMIVAGKAIKAI